MSEVDQRRVLELLSEALGVDDPTQRDQFLASACAGDAALRQQVDALLRTHDDAERVFTSASSEINHIAASHIGPYRLLEVIGEGGMGVVYRAEQLRPVRRTVALKLIKLGMDTRQVIARFESERQALAMMNHPHVARVYDAGATETGRPYFVMEHVAGEAITAFCDRHRYTLRQRLELFMQACDAVQHAHQKAIIHRDLKPSNILVALEDSKPCVKVIDFGIAKAIEHRLTERTLFTEHGQLIGTPEYVSPEQAQSGAGGLDVDTRSDVYSLGVVLYELLTGALPFDPKTLRGAGYHEIQRIIRDTDPPRPSTRLSMLGDDAAEVARRRQVQLSSLRGELRGELEWIPLKAMRKDRAERYASAADLAGDVQNYLQRRPLVAGPPSASYRLRKFLSRHKLTVAAAAAVMLALAAGIVATSIALVGQSRARAEADVRREQAETVINFLTQDILANATPARLPDKAVRDTIVKLMLDPAADAVDLRFADKPVVGAQVRDLLAQCYRLLDRADLSLPLAQRALQLRRDNLGDDHPETLISVNTLASVLKDRGLLVQAEAMHRENVAARTRVLGADHPDTLISVNNLSTLVLTQRRYDEAETLARQALDGYRRNFPADHQHVLTASNNLALVLKAQGKLDEAETIYRQVLERYHEVYGDAHPHTLTLTNNLASLLRTRGRYSDAETLLRRVLEVRRRMLGDEHSDTLGAMHNLAVVLREQQRLDQAEALCRQVLEARERSVGEIDLRTLSAMNNLVAVLMQRRDADAAIPLLEQLQERIARSQLPKREAANYLSNGGRALVKLARYEPAERPLREARRLLREIGEAESPAMPEILAALVRICEKTSRETEAAELRAELERIAPATAPATAPGAADDE